MRRIVHLVMWSGLIVLAAVGAGCNSAWVSSGILYEEQSNYAKAEEMYKRALWYNDEEAAAHYFLGRLLAYRALNEHLVDGEMDSVRIKLADSREHLLRAAELDPEKWEFNPDTDKEADRTPVDDQIAATWTELYNMGAKSLEAKNLEQAETYFDLALLVDPTGKRGFDVTFLRSQLRYNAAIADENDIDTAAVRSALADLQALEVPDTDSRAQDLADLVKIKAQMHRTLGEDDKALALYEELLAENPDDVDLVLRVAQARSGEGDLDGAIELFRRAVDLASASTSMTPSEKFVIAYQAGLSLRDADRWNEALDMGKRAQQYAVDSSQQSRSARLVARAHFELEQYQETVDSIEPVISDGGLDPNNLEGWQLYWRALNSLGRESESLRALERFRELRDAGAGR